MTPFSPDTSGLRPFQIDAIRHVRSVRASLIVADPGLGKSAIALRALADQPRLLVVCNAAAMVSWPLQVAQWDTSGRPLITIDHGDDIDWTMFGGASMTLCVNYDLLGIRDNKALRAALRHWRPTAVVIDECQYLRSSGANRTRAVFGVRHDGVKSLVEAAAFVVELSGTPMPNHAGELWTSYRALWTPYWSDVNGGVPLGEAEWQDRYCVPRDTRYGRVISRSKNIPELRRRMAPFTRRYKKADHAAELPPLSFVDTPIMADKAEIARAALGLPSLVSMSDDEVVDVLSSLPIATARRALGLAKVPGVVAWAEDQLFSGCRKLILFAYHTEVIDRIAAALAEHEIVVFDGRTPPAERARAVSRFQADPRVEVFLGQIDAAGTAITLTAASTVGIAEASWTPTVNFQAACRAHRLGQADGVVCHFLQVPDTTDALVARTYRRKASDIAALFD